jgi:hypothetical protein
MAEHAGLIKKIKLQLPRIKEGSKFKVQALGE